MSVMNRWRSAPGVAFGDVHYPPAGKFGPRIQQQYQLVVMNSGEARIEVDDDEIFVPDHHAVLLLPNHREMFYFTETNTTHHTFCALDADLISPALRENVGERMICLPLTERILKAVDYGLTIPSSTFVSTDDMVRTAGILTLQVFMFEAELVQCPPTLPEAVRRALTFMDDHFEEPVTLSTLADAVAMSPQHLTRLFRQHLQTTPMRYLWQLRTRHGVELLGSTGLSITEIADQVGFQSLFHFSRMVTQYYHTSPSRLRQRMWSGNLASGE